MTLIELFDPHDLAFPLKGQLIENFELEIIKEIPKDLKGKKSNLLIIVGKTYADLEQYKALKDYYLAIVVFIKDMEATQIRSLQHSDESFDAYFAIPWQKTALRFYLEDLAEFKANELKDELELSDKFKGNQTKSDQLQTLFDLAPGEALPFGEHHTATGTNTVPTQDLQLDSAGTDLNNLPFEEDVEMADNDGSDQSGAIDLGDLQGGDDLVMDNEGTKTQHDINEDGQQDHSKTINIDSLDDFDLDLESDSQAGTSSLGVSEESRDSSGDMELGDIAEEDSDDNLFGLDDQNDDELSFEAQDSISLTEEESDNDSGDTIAEDDDFSADDLDFAINDDLDFDISDKSEDAPKEKEDANNQPSLSLSEDAVQKLKEIDKILDNDILTEQSISKIAQEDSLELSLSDEDESSQDSLADGDEIDFGFDSDDSVPSDSIADEDEIDFSHDDDDSVQDISLTSDEGIALSSEESESDSDSEEEEPEFGAENIADVDEPADEKPYVEESLNNSSSDLFSREGLLDEEDETVDETIVISEHKPAPVNKPVIHFEGDLERAGAIIAELRSERDYLEKRLNELEKEKMLKETSTLDMRAELNEKKIELQIIKKRHHSDLDQLKLQLNDSEERRILSEEKRKYLEQELDNARGKVSFDLKKIKSRERELEDRIDLIKKDAEVQIRNRDSSIIDLKRKIDMLEFNLDNAVQKDKLHIETRYELENKVDKVMQTLRNAIGVLEDDIRDSNINKVDGDTNG